MAKRESSFINMVVTLFAVTFIASATLGGIYEITKEPIAKALQAKKEASITKVLTYKDKALEFDTIKSYSIMPKSGEDSLFFNEAYKGDELVGTAVETYTDNGFSGRFTIMVGFFPDGKIINTAVLSHKETPGLGAEVENEEWKNIWKGKILYNTDGGVELKVVKGASSNKYEIDGLSGATLTSNGVSNMIEYLSNVFWRIKLEG